ncbi:dephospho-CoA kinase [Mycobacterium sp. 1274756.6]|uniref:dephospho-CoA kinase n=1 Tax=Mycobacterium sp. 1274756.6 TaxID=1834076 RepID=UPI0007FF18EA|nr:dephospho-CoA kinase [Mycobacterium sp. 1274756.6]OBJ71667.1 dephospho-CoA kinase [Mycobacterium sp. 1274756.6]
MLRIGLTGGIGAGKSTVSATFRDCGGIIVDGDVLAREVVEPGTEGLAALVAEFGEQILLPGGALNRPALAKVAFGDDAKRARLNQIVHPLVARRRAELIEAADPDAVIIEDIPLLVESGMAPLFPLVIVVHTDAETRVARVTESRGMAEADARARIAAQATDEQRRAVADVWLDNSGTPRQLADRARELWHQRILPFADHLAAGTPAPEPDAVVAADPTWADQAQRIVARLNTACGHHAVRVDHVGPTAVPGRDAPDVIDVQVTVRSLEVADDLAGALVAAGYPRVAEVDSDPALPGARSTVAALDRAGDAGKDNALWRKRFHASADPGRATRVHLRVDGWPNQQFALLAVDWLTANPDEAAGANPGGDLDAYRRAWSWADGSGWDC